MFGVEETARRRKLRNYVKQSDVIGACIHYAKSCAAELKCPSIAANRLRISTRQLRRIAQRYRTEGPTGLISRHCSRPGNNRLDASLEAQVVKILRESYPDFGPTLAAEKLQQRHGITVAKETRGGFRWTPDCGSHASFGRRRSSSRGHDVPASAS